MTTPADLTTEQTGNAAFIAKLVLGIGGTQWDAACAVACAMQESSLRNLPAGDKDSVGLFQQRPSMGWGTVAECGNRTHATIAFCKGNPPTAGPGLFDVPNRAPMSMAQQIQAVQQSADGGLYAKWQALATQLVSAAVRIPMTAPVPVSFMAARYSGGPRPHSQLDFIVVHDVEAPLANGVAANVAGFFAGPGDPGNPTSAHAVVGPDAIVEMLKPDMVAWQCGNGNQRGYGIEQCGYAAFSRSQWTNALASKQMHNYAWWAASIARQYGLPARWLSDSELATPGVKGFCTHADVTRVLGGTTHTDPGPNYPRDLLMAAIKVQLNGGTTAPADPLDWINMTYTQDQFEAMLTSKIEKGVHAVLAADSVVGAARFGSNFQAGVEKAVDARLTAIEQAIAALVAK